EVVSELHRGLRTRFIVGDDKRDRAAFDAAFGIYHRLDRLQRFELGLADESDVAGKGEDGVYLIRLGRAQGRCGGQADGRDEKSQATRVFHRRILRSILPCRFDETLDAACPAVNRNSPVYWTY